MKQSFTPAISPTYGILPVPILLYTTLTRYARQGLLFRVYKGLYSIVPPERIDPFLLGIKAIHGYAYISTESVLYKHGIIDRNSALITVVSEQSRTFTAGGNRYLSRQMADRYLFNPAGISVERGVRVASVERAIADLFYYNPRVVLDNPEEVNWNAVREIQTSIGWDCVT